MKKLAAVLAMALVAGPAFGDVVYVYGAQITKVYTQSRLDSTAHLIQVDHTLNGGCSSNRLYIDLDDKELLSSALANYIAGRQVDLMYFTNGAPKSISGHIAGITCRLVSIF
jgi:hypothetical protein